MPQGACDLALATGPQLFRCRRYERALCSNEGTKDDLMMDRTEIVANAVRGLLANKLRAALGVFGIAVGIATLVAIVALIRGASAYVTERLATLQPDVFQVSQLTHNFLNA